MIVGRLCDTGVAFVRVGYWDSEVGAVGWSLFDAALLLAMAVACDASWSSSASITSPCDEYYGKLEHGLYRGAEWTSRCRWRIVAVWRVYCRGYEHLAAVFASHSSGFA